jgi:hypothetical protein
MKALSINPFSPVLLCLAGMCYLSEGQPLQALQVLSKSKKFCKRVPFVSFPTGAGKSFKVISETSFDASIPESQGSVQKARVMHTKSAFCEEC